MTVRQVIAKKVRCSVFEVKGVHSIVVKKVCAFVLGMILYWPVMIMIMILYWPRLHVWIVCSCIENMTKVGLLLVFCTKIMLMNVLSVSWPIRLFYCFL